MTMTLDAPTEAPDLVVIEEHQHDVPLVCTDRGWGYDREDDPECGKTAYAEGMCMGCGEVIRRCREHYEDEVARGAHDGRAFRHLRCSTWFYLAQYVRIPA